MNKILINVNIQGIKRANKLRREFLKQFLNKISNFPSWVKEIIYNKLSEEIDNENTPAYIFATYKPILTYKGRCENEFKKSGFDTNIYNILDSADRDCSISDITLNTYLSMEELAGYFLFCVDEGYFEIPDNSQILNIAGFLTGKYTTGEYFVNNGTISSNELENTPNFGHKLVELGLISQKQLDTLLNIKEEAKKRFILDYNEVPKIKQQYAKETDNYLKQIEELKAENARLKAKLEQLLTMVKKYD